MESSKVIHALYTDDDVLLSAVSSLEEVDLRILAPPRDILCITYTTTERERDEEETTHR